MVVAVEPRVWPSLALGSSPFGAPAHARFRLKTAARNGRPATRLTVDPTRVPRLRRYRDARLGCSWRQVILASVCGDESAQPPARTSLVTRTPLVPDCP